MHFLVAASLILILASCGGDPPAGEEEASDNISRAVVERVLDDAVADIAQLADSVDDVLQPVPLLTGAEEGALRRFGNEEHLMRARSLGVRPADSVEFAAVRASGRLVELEDSTALWVVRELDHSVPFVTPSAQALLTHIAEQFQQRLEEMGLPPYRLEVTSVMRTAESQAGLRETNPNAAAGVSTHEFGTTLDIAYSSYAAPQDPQMNIDLSAAPWLEVPVDQFAAAMLEAAAARKSREFQAILGKILIDLQRSGDVLVTLERQQPVFHITVGKGTGG